MNLKGLERLVHSPKLRRMVEQLMQQRFSEFIASLPKVYAASAQDPLWTVRNEAEEGSSFEARLLLIGDVLPPKAGEPIEQPGVISRPETKSLAEVINETSTPENSPY